ncbi:hypothetical protein [Neolewinella agarilytica]|nr:hypothetical protein [Neolewinella agarilytica]
MKDINNDLLDAPTSPNTKSAVWAKVGAIGVAGTVLSTLIRLY